MKSIYLLLMFGTTTAMGLYYGHIIQEREHILEELNNLFKHLLIHISSKTGVLVECIREYKPSGYIDEFLKVLTEKLECGCVCPFETAAKELYSLKKEDMLYIKSISIGNLDSQGQIKALENAVCYFDQVLQEERKSSNKRQVLSYSGILAGLMLVIIFI